VFVALDEGAIGHHDVSLFGATDDGRRVWRVQAAGEHPCVGSLQLSVELADCGLSGRHLLRGAGGAPSTLCTLNKYWVTMAFLRWFVPDRSNFPQRLGRRLARTSVTGHGGGRRRADQKRHP
jgi:hypothetical protein